MSETDGISTGIAKVLEVNFEKEVCQNYIVRVLEPECCDIVMRSSIDSVMEHVKRTIDCFGKEPIRIQVIDWLDNTIIYEYP